MFLSNNSRVNDDYVLPVNLAPAWCERLTDVGAGVEDWRGSEEPSVLRK